MNKINDVSDSFSKMLVSKSTMEDKNSLQKEKANNKTKNSEKKGITYVAESVIGTGTFGVLYLAVIPETKEYVAIKRVFQDKRYKNREHSIMKEIQHQNCVKLLTSFFSNDDEKPDDVYLNLVMDYVPSDLYKILKYFRKQKQIMPDSLVKLYSYQMLRSLAYIHSMGICHRDIKPQNVLVDPETHIVKLCDFGSAKKLQKDEANIAYICSRYYRAPELIFGATEYSFSIDVWSLGCVIAEILLGEPIFPGDSSVDQIVEIIKVLGTPSNEEIKLMKGNGTQFKFPSVNKHPWSKLFKSTVNPLAIDLIDKLLVYVPEKRLKACEALGHPYFDDLRKETFRIDNKKLTINLFDFTLEELGGNISLKNKLVPSWYKQK